MSKKPNHAEIVAANTVWSCLVKRSEEIATAKMNKIEADVRKILKECGVKDGKDDMEYYVKMIMDCPVANPW